MSLVNYMCTVVAARNQLPTVASINGRRATGQYWRLVRGNHSLPTRILATLLHCTCTNTEIHNKNSTNDFNVLYYTIASIICT